MDRFGDNFTRCRGGGVGPLRPPTARRTAPPRVNRLRGNASGKFDAPKTATGNGRWIMRMFGAGASAVRSVQGFVQRDGLDAVPLAMWIAKRRIARVAHGSACRRLRAGRNSQGARFSVMISARDLHLQSQWRSRNRPRVSRFGRGVRPKGVSAASQAWFTWAGVPAFGIDRFRRWQENWQRLPAAAHSTCDQMLAVGVKCLVVARS